MISVILYGRNDNYGYNLHKRAALSLNCIAEVLRRPTDEIIFVDYNTPDDFPTFPEAISDTLTDTARRMLRILRVRPSVHERFRTKTRLVAIEPVARNVGVRRSRPENRWVLSTNTDMIFVPRKGNSISDLVEDLPRGFYHAPRIEIPETLWESLDRRDAAGIIAKVREWGSTLHLNEIVLGAETIRYDAPGDFQLIERQDLFDIHGFNEDMLLGWHVDSNIAKRLYLKYGAVGDIGEQLFGYHCDHTRQITPMHSHARTQNDPSTFIDLVTNPELPMQADTWGCADDEVEEVNLSQGMSRIFVKALEEAIGAPLAEPVIASYTGEYYNKVDYDPRHVMPFLADLFAASPRNSNVAWFGGRLDTLVMFVKVWTKLGRTGKIYCDDKAPPEFRGFDLGVEFVPSRILFEHADAFIFDFAPARDMAGELLPDEIASRVTRHLRQVFFDLIRYERLRTKSKMAGRRIIGVNAINNSYETFVREHVGAGVTPYSTRLRHGFALPPTDDGVDNWLPYLHAGANGIRTEAGFMSVADTPGAIVYGPYKYLSAGKFRLGIGTNSPEPEDKLHPQTPVLLVEITESQVPLDWYFIAWADVKKGRCSLIINIPDDIEQAGGIETRIYSLVPVAVELVELTITDALPHEQSEVTSPSEISDWLPVLARSAGVKFENTHVVVPVGVSGHVIYGPYWPLPTGKYNLLIVLDRLEGDPEKSYLGKVEVVVQSRRDPDRVLADLDVYINATAMWREDATSEALCVPFEITPEFADRHPIETRMWTPGDIGFRIRALRIEPRARDAARPLPLYGTNWLPHLAFGPSASADARGIKVAASAEEGYPVFGPYWKMPEGAYQLVIQLERLDDSSEHSFLGKAEVTVFPDQRIAFLDIYVNALSVLAPGAENEPIRIPFKISSKFDGTPIETRFWSPGDVSFLIRAMSVEPADTKSTVGAIASGSKNWTHHLALGRHAVADQFGILVVKGAPDYAVYGPYWPLRAGSYQMRVSLERLPGGDRHESYLGKVDVFVEGRSLASADVYLNAFSAMASLGKIEPIRVPFEVPLEFAGRPLETRLWSAGELDFRIRAMWVEAAEPDGASSTLVPIGSRDWFFYLPLGPFAVVDDQGIRADKGGASHVVFGPFWPLPTGSYRLLISIERLDGDPRDNYLGKVDVFADGRSLASLDVALNAFSTLAPNLPIEPLSMNFEISPELADGHPIETRFWSAGAIGVRIRSLWVEAVDPEFRSSTPIALGNNDWLFHLSLGEQGVADRRGIRAKIARAGTVLFGPYWPLDAGHYELVVGIASTSLAFESLHLGRIDVVWERGEHVLAASDIRISFVESIKRETKYFRIPFEITADIAGKELVETRVSCSGVTGFRVLSMTVTPVKQ